MIAGWLLVLSGCVSGRNKYGLIDMHFAAPKFATDDPLRLCVDTPDACPKAPQLNCSYSVVADVERRSRRNPDTDIEGQVSCVEPAKTQGTPNKTYDIVLDVQCYPPVVQRVTLDKAWSGRFEIPAPAPVRRFLSSETQVGRFPDGLPSPFRRSSSWIPAPALAELELLRDWPLGDASAGCQHVVARVVDAAGVFEPGTLIVVPKKALTDVRPEGQTVASQLAAQTAEKERQAAARKEAVSKAAEAARATSEQESKSGRCTDERSAFMQRALSNFKRLMETNKFTLASNHIVVAGGAPLRLRTGLAGEYHVFALAFDDSMKLQVRDATGQAAALKSAYAGISRSVTDAASDSAVFEGNAVSNLSVSLTGKGCALVTVFYKYGE